MDNKTLVIIAMVAGVAAAQSSCVNTTRKTDGAECAMPPPGSEVGPRASKCCPLGEVFEMPSKKCMNASSARTDLTRAAAAVHRYDARSPCACGFDHFAVTTTGTKELKERCPQGRYHQSYLPFFLQEDGMLYLKMAHTVSRYLKLPAEEYCIDTFLHTDSNGTQSATLEALVCFPEDHVEDNTISTIGMLISSVFLLLTLAVHVAVPELRNMHGRVLMAYLASLLVAFVFLSTLQLSARYSSDGETPSICLSFSFVIYFALLAAFFWLNVMCFDIWWTFSGYSQMRRSHVFAYRRYALYCVYAFGVPSVLTALLAALEFSPDLPDHIVTPKLRQQGCFLAGEAKLLYLYLPMLVLCAANTALFVMTALRIARVRRQTAVLKGGDSSTHDQYRKDKQRLFLYVKLFVVMGVNWALEVISGLLPRVPVLWKITDAYNVLIGFTIFVIFICKKKIFRLIKKRYDLARGAPPSRSHTCSTRNTSTASRDDMRLPPLLSCAPAPAPAAAAAPAS